MKWRELSREDRQRALDLIQSERIMWRIGKDHNWHEKSLPAVRRNWRVLGVAMAELRRLGKKK